jgi:hypothetical protein
LEARAAAFRAVDALPVADRTAFLSRRVNLQLWESLQDAAEESPTAAAPPEPVPTDWCAWLAHLDRTEGRSGSREIARRAATEWSVDDFLHRPGIVEQFAGQLAGRRSQSAERALRDSLPHLVHFFARDPAWPNPALKGVYRPLLELLYFSTDGGRADLVVFNDLLEAVLALGVTGQAYSELVSYASELWGRFAAPATLDWAGDALALFAEFPCPNPGARRALLQAIFDRSAGFGSRVGAEDRGLLRLLARDLGAADLVASYFPPEAEAEGVGEDTFAPLRTMSLSAYTLTERAGKQFQAVIEALAPGVKVSLAHDTEASPRLRQLARQSDLFVLVTASAKHAASDCVRANRPAEKPTLMPAGKGAASMLAAVRSYCEQQGE